MGFQVRTLACDNKSKSMETYIKIVLAVCFVASTAHTANAACSQGSIVIQNADGLILAINGLMDTTGSGELCVVSDLTFDTLIEFGTVLPLIKGINITIVGDCPDYCYINSLNGLSFMAISGMDMTIKFCSTVSDRCDMPLNTMEPDIFFGSSIYYYLSQVGETRRPLCR